MENVLYLSAALAVAVGICVEIRNAHRRSPLIGAQPVQFILPVNEPRDFREHTGSDGLESFGFSQGVHSVHNGGNIRG